MEKSILSVRPRAIYVRMNLFSTIYAHFYSFHAECNLTLLVGRNDKKSPVLPGHCSVPSVSFQLVCRPKTYIDGLCCI